MDPIGCLWSMRLQSHSFRQKVVDCLLKPTPPAKTRGLFIRIGRPPPRPDSGGPVACGKSQ